MRNPLRLPGFFERRSSRKTDADKALDAMARSSRIGTRNGKSAMPFHCHISSVKVGQDPVAPIDYLARCGDYADRTDLVHLAGDADAVEQGAKAVNATARCRNGKSTERMLQLEVFELPSAITPEAAIEVAEREVERWRQRGRPAVAAVHFPEPKPDGRVNPHIHVATPARPILVMDLPDGPLHVANRQRQTLTVGSAALRDERQAIADLINQVMVEHNIEAPEFVPGRLASVGIERKAKRRVPEARYHAAGQRDQDPEQVRQARARHLAAAAAREEARKAKAAARKERLERRGLAPQEDVNQAYRKAASEITRITEVHGARHRQSAAEVERLKAQLEQVEARVQELLAASPSPSPDDVPATARQMMVLFDMLEERGKFLTDPDAPMTAAGAGELIRQLKALPVIRPEMPSSPSQAPQSGRKASGPSSLPPSPQRAPVPLESLLGEPPQDECVGYDVIVGDDRASSKAILPSWDDATDLAGRATARGEPVRITADGIEERPLKLSVNVRGPFKEVADQLSRIGTAAGVGLPHDLQVANGLIAVTWALVDQEQTASLRSQLVAAGYRSITPSTSQQGRTKPSRGLER